MDFDEMRGAYQRATETQPDIVRYLRYSQTRFNRHAEAADEIERLRAKANTTTIAPSNSVLVLKLPQNGELYTPSELVEIADQMKLKLGVDVCFIQGWDVVGFWERQLND